MFQAQLFVDTKVEGPLRSFEDVMPVYDDYDEEEYFLLCPVEPFHTAGKFAWPVLPAQPTFSARLASYQQLAPPATLVPLSGIFLSALIHHGMLVNDVVLYLATEVGFILTL